MTKHLVNVTKELIFSKTHSHVYLLLFVIIWKYFLLTTIKFTILILKNTKIQKNMILIVTECVVPALKYMAKWELIVE